MSAATITVRSIGERGERGPDVTYSGASVTSIVRRVYGRRATYSPRSAGRTIVGVVSVPDRTYGTVVVAHVTAVSGPYAPDPTDRIVVVTHLSGATLGAVTPDHLIVVRTGPRGAYSTTRPCWRATAADGAHRGLYDRRSDAVAIVSAPLAWWRAMAGIYSLDLSAS